MGQTYFKDIEVGQTISMTQNCNSQRLVMWAGATDDFYQIHYDKDYAINNKLPDRIVHGLLKHALLGRLLAEWAGHKGRVLDVAVQYRGMDLVEQDVVCKGVVTGKRVEDRKNLVDLEVWTEDPEGKKTTPGTAIVALP